LINGEAVALDVRPASFILRERGGNRFRVHYRIVPGAHLPTYSWCGHIDEALAQALFIATSSSALSSFLSRADPRSVARQSRHRRELFAMTVEQVPFVTLFIRALTQNTRDLPHFGGLAILVPLGTPNQRLGDLLAGTYSQHERVPAVTASALALPAQLVAWAPLADVAKLPDRLARRIAQYLAQASKMTPQIRERLSAELAREALPFVSPLPDVHPEVLLVGIAVLRRDREYRGLILDQNRLDRLTPVLTGLPHGFPDR
jgi:hypothetical protein